VRKGKDTVWLCVGGDGLSVTVWHACSTYEQKQRPFQFPIFTGGMTRAALFCSDCLGQNSELAHFNEADKEGMRLQARIL
jgi:hypothetical protein